MWTGACGWSCAGGRRPGSASAAGAPPTQEVEPGGPDWDLRSPGAAAGRGARGAPCRASAAPSGRSFTIRGFSTNWLARGKL